MSEPIGRHHDLTRADEYPGVQVLHRAAPQPKHDKDDDDVVDLREYWRMLVRRRWTIFITLGIALASALLATFLATPTYRGTLLMQIELESGKVLEYQTVTPEESGGDTKDFYKTQYELLSSRTLARRVIDQLGLQTSSSLGLGEKSFISSILSDLKKLLPDTDGGRPKEPDLEQLFLDNLSVHPVSNSRLVRINYDSPDPEEAARVVNVVAENFINMNLERRFEASSYAKDFLEKRITQVRASLEDSERSLVAYAREREIVNLEDKVGILTDRLREMNTELGAIEAARIEAEAEYQTMAANDNDTAFTGVLDSPVVQELKARKLAIENEYQENLRLFKPGTPKMQQLQEQLAEVKRQIQEEVQAIRTAAQHRYETKLEQETKLRQRVAEIKEEILTMQDRSSDHQTLVREVETNRELYDSLLQRMKEIGVAAGIGTNNISIIDRAPVPLERFKPRLSTNLAIALALGVFGGALLAFLSEAFDDSLKSAADMERAIGAPVLGLVPDVVRESSLSPDEVPLLVHADPRSVLAEAYRSIRAALVFSASEGAPRILHFTSSGAREGKTTASLSAAITFAQNGAKVLLIDGDMRRPSLHRIFQYDNQKGLSYYLSSDVKAFEVTRATPIDNLFLISSGPLPPKPVELLSSARMLDLLSVAAERFDYIVLDGPPVLGLADALVLANLAEATVFIAALGETRAGAARSSIKRLRAAHANILGGLLNKVASAGSGYGEDYYYSYQYNYGAEEYGRLSVDRS